MDALEKLELRQAAFEQVLAETREELRRGAWRTTSLVKRMRDRAEAALAEDPTSLVGSALKEFADEMERPR